MTSAGAAAVVADSPVCRTPTLASIPGIGPILSPVLTPLLLIVGVGLGAMRDLADGSMRIELSGLEAYFRDLGVA